MQNSLTGHGYYDLRALRVKGFASGIDELNMPPLTPDRWRRSLSRKPIREYSAAQADALQAAYPGKRNRYAFHEKTRKAETL